MPNDLAAKQLREPKFVPFHIPQIDEEEIRSVVETLRSGWLTTGKGQKFRGGFRPIRRRLTCRGGQFRNRCAASRTRCGGTQGRRRGYPANDDVRRYC